MFLPAFPLIYLIVRKYGREGLVYLLILSFLLTASTMNEMLRKVIILGGTGVLSYLAFFRSFYEKRVLKPVPKDIFAFAVFVTVTSAVSSLLSINPIVGLTAVIKQAFFFYIVYLVYQLSFDYDSMKMLNGITLITALFVTAGTLFMFLSLGFSAIINSEAALRTSGIYENVNAAGSIIALGTIILFGAVLAGFGGSDKKIRNISYFILFLFTFGLLITNSRASLLLVGFSSVVLFIIFRRHLVKYGIAAAVFIAVLFYVSPQLDEILEIYLRLDRLLNIRDHLWKISFDTIRENPVWGTGPDVFKEYFYKYLPVLIGSYPESKIRGLYEVAGTSGLSHNFLLYRFTELGIPGLISALWLPFIYFKYGFTALDVTREKDPQKAGYILVLIVLGIGIFLRSAFESIGIMTYGWIMLDLPFWFLLIILVNYASSDYSPEKKFTL